MFLVNKRRAAWLCVLPFALAGAGPDSVSVVNPGEIRDAARSGAAFTVKHFQLAVDTTVDLELQRFYVTRPGTRFVVGNVAGDDVAWDFDPDRVTLLRGRVAGEPDSHVFMALSEWGSSGRIDHGGTQYALWGDATTMTVSRPAVSGALSPDVPFCGTVIPVSGQPATRQALSAGVLPEITQQIEIAIETDYELFQLFGDLDATGAYMVELWGAVSDIYLRDVNTRIVMVFVRLWDDPDDLFNGDPLAEFVDYWQTNMAGVDRDVAQFVSGRRDFPYGGAAYLSALCGDFAYGVAGYMIGHFDGLEVPSVFGYDIQVTAHELGHNAGALHTHSYGLDTCDDLYGVPQRGTIMSYCSQTRSGGNGNTDLRFHGNFVQPDMRNYIFFNAPCVVDDCNGNGVDDAVDIAMGTSDDDNGNGIADECEDCNNNGTLDPVDISLGTSLDLNTNGIPDECEPDCNGNDVPDDRDIRLGTETDLQGNGIPDSCETDCNGNGISDYNEIQIDMSLDLDRNAALDACQDCDGDEVSDLEELEGAHNTWIASLGAPLGEYHAVSGVKMAESIGGALNDPQDLIITADRRILVSDNACDCVREYDRNGLYVGDLVASGSGGLNYPTGLAISPAGNLLVASRNTDNVLEYSAVGGAFLGEFVSSGPLAAPWGIAFGPNGNLFVTSLGWSVIEYDGLTGSLIGDFVTTADNGGLFDPHGLLFKPNGNLLVTSYFTDQILEFDALTGAFIGQFNHGGTDTVLTLDQPWTLRLGPDGDVYVTRHGVSVAQELAPASHEQDDVEELHINSTRIYIFDVDSGNFVRSYVTGHDTGLSLPGGFDFMPGDMTDCNNNQLPDSCDIASGFSSDVNGNGTPDECESGCPGDVDGDGTVGINDFLDLLAAWGPNPGHPADIDDDGFVGINDFLALLAAWGPCV